MAQGMCNACGADVTDEDNFCPNCGASLSEVGVTASAVPGESAEGEITPEAEQAAAPADPTSGAAAERGVQNATEPSPAARRGIVLAAALILLVAIGVAAAIASLAGGGS